MRQATTGALAPRQCGRTNVLNESLAIANFVFWIGMTIAVLVFGLLLVAVAPRQAANAAATI